MATMIVGMPTDMPSQRIYEKLQARNHDVFYLDTLRMPSEIQATYGPSVVPEDSYQFFDPVAGIQLPLSELQSVYRRWSKGVTSPHEDDPMLNEIVYWNIESFVQSFMRCTRHALWINPQTATLDHNHKPYQLQLLHSAGIRIPETVITNHPESVREFYEKHPGRSIFKPVRGWAHTEPLTPEMLTDERLETLSRSPVTLQEKISGRDLRIYVVHRDIYAMEIESDNLDFRETPNAPRHKITLPEDVQADCFKIADTLDYVFTGIDCRRTPDGEYVYFEANPTPVFLYDEDVTGYPISDRLCDYLVAGRLD